MEELGKLMLLFGASFLIVGTLLVLVSKLTGLGRLPGDIVIQIGNLSCFFPIVSSILLSIMLTILLNIILRMLSR